MTTKKTFGKRALSLLLTLLMVLSLVPVSILSVSAAADTSAYAPTRRENYYNDDDAIFANGTAITIEEAPNGTRIWYMSGSTKTYVTANGENGEDLSEWRIFAGSNNQDGMSGVNGSITMTGGTVNRIYAGQHYGGFSGISNITILGGTVKEAIVCNSRAMVSSNDYINTVNIFDVTGATISTAGGKADNVVQKKGTVWNVSGNGVVPSGFTITVNEGETLTVPAGSTLTNNGTIVNNGGTIKLYGQLKGNTPQGYAPLSDVSLSTEAVPANSSTTLTATLTPADNVIMPVVSYELIDAGTTGAVLNGTNLSVYSEGTVKIKVTVSDGYCTPVEKIFAIPVTFTKVTDITGNVPTESWVNVSNTLPAMTVTPDNASYKALTWSVLNAGTTGAQINGNKLIATNSGTATIRATVANGLAYGTDFVKDYTVTFNSTDKLDISVGSITISKKDDSTLTVSFSGFDGGSKDYAADEPIEITGSTTANNIVVESGTVANIVLNNVEIIGNDKLRAIEIKSGAEADIALVGENTLTGRSGIYINSNSKATIGGTGVLNATTLYNGSHGAIGGLGEGEIVVNGGTITATGENTYNSGIVGTKITINDGIVSATAGGEGVGIGSRRTADYATDVIINGGTVTASGSAGIGGGYGSSGTFSVTINDGIVTASGRGGCAGIGGGRSAGKVIINGGNITSSSINYGAGIGGGQFSKAVDVTINGGTVTSTKTGAYRYGAAIGGGYYAETGNIVITGGNIKADSGSTYAEDIGKGYYAESEGTLTDGKGNNVYLNTITLEGASEQKAVTEVKGVENYGLNDVKTLDTNMLYFYLPETDNLNSLYLENDLYTGALTGTTEKTGTFTLHTQHNFENGFCTGCGEECEHNFENSICTICGKSCEHNFENGTCTICGKSCEHNFENGFCTVCDVFEPATDENEDGVYEIGNAGQLYWFADYINNVRNDAYAKLAADIVVNETLDENSRVWTPIMDFYGNFDGNCHTVSGLYVKSEEDQIGMFGGGYYSYGTVENLGLINSYFEGNDNVGGIAGYHAGTIKNCYVTDTVTVVGNNLTGTLVGNNAGTVSNCYAYASTLVGSYHSGYATVENCYYLADTDDGEGGKTAEQFKSGEVAYLLQSGVVGEEIWDDELGEYVQTEPEHIWGQKIGEDTYPVFGGDKVYTVNKCNDEVAGYSNTEGEILDHDFENGFCTVCDGFEPATLNEDGVYEIANAGQLYWFAEYVNAGNTSVNAILTADIVVNEGVMTAESEGARAWTPIGNYDYQYTGTFDGNNHTVSGLYFNNSEAQYVGLFGYIGENSEVKNTGVINSYIKGNSSVGGVVGYNNVGTMTNCYNTGSSILGVDYVGGVVGFNKGTITNCYNTSDVSGEYSAGGFVGRNIGSIANCYNTGNVTGDNVGGIVYDNYGTITNCYNSGKINGSVDTQNGIACFGNDSNRKHGMFTQCYYIGDSDDDSIDGTTAMNTEQFKSGEVAYLLGDAFGQKIGTDTYPVLSGDKVYYVTNCKSENIYSNTNENDQHNVVDDSCTNCGLSSSTVMEIKVLKLAIKRANEIADENNVLESKKEPLDDIYQDLLAVGKQEESSQLSRLALVKIELTAYNNKLQAGIADGTWVKADYTEIDAAVAEIESSGATTDKMSAKLDEIKSELSVMKESSETSKADVDVLMKEVETLKDCVSGNHIFENGKCTICGVEEHVDKLAGYTISLGDKIAVNYYMSLTEKTLNDANSKMVFTVPDTGSTYTVEIPVSEAVKSGDYYVFTCEVAAKEMTSVIKAKLVTSESELQLDDYTVQEYAEVILSDTVKYAKEQKLVKKMLNYGAQAQIYFNYNTDNLANDTELMTEEEKTVELYGFAGAPFTLEGEETGVTYYGTALSLETELAFKHYFIIDESVDTQSLEITCDYPATLKKNGSFYELIISDIPAHKMGENSMVVTIGGMTLDYTIYSYGALVQNSGNEELWTVVSALAHFAGEATMYAYK